MGLILLIWLWTSFAFAFLCAWIASQKGRTAVAWFFLGLFFDIFALIGIIAVPKLVRNGKESHSDRAVSPGEYLQEVINSLGMSRYELAHIVGCPLDKLTGIFEGTQAITPDIARELEKAVGVPAQMWLELEREYRKTRGSLYGL